MNPNNLTKQQLRASLMGYNVFAPVAARKDVLIGLYASHVMFSNNCKSATIRVRTQGNSEFSGDDDADHIQQATQTEGKTESKGFFGWLSNVSTVHRGNGKQCQEDTSKTAGHTNSTNNVVKNGGRSKTSNGNGQQRKRTSSKSPRRVTFEDDNKTHDKPKTLEFPKLHKIPKAPPARRKRCMAMTGPVRRQSPNPCSTALRNILPCLPYDSGGNDCFGGGGSGGGGGGIGSWFGYGTRRDDCSRPPSVSNSLLRCMSPPHRKSPNRFPTPHAPRYLRTSWEERQNAPPTFWNPCMLPGRDELDDRIRDRDAKKLCSRQAKKSSRSIGLRKSNPMALSQAQIEVMTDTELLETLRQHGFECGPVVPTTRVLYQKKLLRLLSNGEVKWSKHPEMGKTYDREVDLEEDDDYSDEEDEEMVTAELDPIRTRRGRVAPPERSYHSDDRSLRRRFEADDDRSPRRRFAEDIRHTSTTYSRTPLAQDSRETAEEKLARKERRVPFYLKFLIFIFVSVIIYAIVYHLEPVFKHPFSQIQ